MEGYITWTSTVQITNYVYNVEQVDVYMATVDDGSGTAPPKTQVSLVVIDIIIIITIIAIIIIIPTNHCGMQDYNYLFAGCMEITLEISCCKYPPPEELPEYWEDNRDALMEYIKQVHRGVKGIVRNEQGTALEGAEVKIVGRDITFRTTKEGEYWKLLLPGSYELQMSTWQQSDYGSGTALQRLRYALVVIVMLLLLGRYGIS
eukprot:XP_011665133.1 PREDICTED: carboxypeptidase M-like [Strongylocentrotus purpuratus]